MFGKAVARIPQFTRVRRRYNTGMVLSPQGESLISVIRTLPQGEAEKALAWAQELADLGEERTIRWADSWSDEDLADATRAALRRLEDEERGEA